MLQCSPSYRLVIFVTGKLKIDDMEQECANRVTADSMVDNSSGVEITSKPAQDHDSWGHAAYLGDRRHTQGGGEKDVEVVGTTGVKLPHNRFTCSEVCVLRKSRAVLSE